MKRFLPVLAGVLLCAPGATAYTVDELVKENGYYAVDRLYWSRFDRVETYMGSYEYDFAGQPLGRSNGLHFEYVTNLNGEIQKNQVKLVGFIGFNGLAKVQKDFIFVLADENNDTTTDGTRLILENEDYYPGPAGCLSTDKTYMLTAGYARDEQWLLEQLDIYGYGYPIYVFGSKYSYGSPYVDYWIGEISRGADGCLRVDFNEPAAFVNSSKYSIYTFGRNTTTNHDKIIDKYCLELYRPNGVFNCTEMPYNRINNINGSYTTGTAKSFPVKITFDGKGGFDILNLTGNGYAIEESSYSRYAHHKLTGSYDITTGEVRLHGGQEAAIVYNTMSSYQWRQNVVIGRVGNVDVSTRKNNYNDVVGTLTMTDGEIKHIVTHNHWVDFGGTCRTVMTNGKMTLPAFAYFHYSSGELYDGTPYERFESSPAYTGGTLDDIDIDITLDITLSMEKLGVSATQLWPVGFFEVKNNDTYVDRYEVWMAPGKYNYGDVIRDESFNDENGHRSGFKICDIDPAEPVATGSGEHGYPKMYTFSRLFDKALMPETDASDNYIFYVKAIYKEPAKASAAPGKARAASYTSQLNPTFHGGTGASIKTGTESITVPESNAKVSVDGSDIVIEWSDAPAAVYNTQGAEVYFGNDRRITMSVPGIYIVRVGDATSKVLVR